MKADSTRKYMAYNGWRGSPKKSYMFSHFSDDGGFNFINKTQVMELGEDKSFIWNNDTQEFWGYVRPRNIEPVCNNPQTIGNGVRKIALMKNSMRFPSSGDWSNRDTILFVESSDYSNSGSPDYRTQTYYMQVFRNGNDWWGLVGMYRVGNNGEESKAFPYTFPEYTSDVELVWSDNGEDWCRTNNRQPILALHDSIKTIYAVGTIVNDSVYFYSAESTILHASYRSINGCTGYIQDSAKNGKFYSIYLYKMSIDKLNEWRPSSNVNIYCAVEGFLNTGTGKHNLRDTLTAELRNSTSPYGVAATVKSVIDSVTFLGNFNFPHVDPGNYYLAIYGRNSLETWSDSVISICNGIDADHNFTIGKAYGGNLIQKGSTYFIYSGDLNSDDFIDNDDQTIVDNDISIVATGYVVSDVNGDYVVDISDGAIVENNVEDFIATIRP
ncbi:MAG: hypothetical protein JSS91_11225 [Bacteroidetes bacterium]|nr:hypothetical protein [Bacteroidota bacterium]